MIPSPQPPAVRGRPAVEHAVAARREEERVAADLGGIRQPGSGSRPHSKGDVRARRWLGELKHTARPVFSLRYLVLETIAREAARVGLRPFLRVEFRLRGADTRGVAWIGVEGSRDAERLAAGEPSAGMAIRVEGKSFRLRRGDLELLERQAAGLPYVMLSFTGRATWTLFPYARVRERLRAGNSSSHGAPAGGP